eukprot:c14024_g1_i2.p1 GENE.c14024_g1_i2~~c14024_g1_i2.p1  ORF type:complete len:412 (+),score=64.13 c14024_g1_i2:73-1308(+)
MALPNPSLFGLDPGHVHLNHGSFGVVPKAVRDAQAAMQAEVESCPDTFYRETRDRVVARSRAVLSDFLDGEPSGLVFIRNATDGINCTIQSMCLKPGNVVLCFAHVIYASCHHALSRECERRGATLVELRVPILNATADDYSLAVEGALRSHGAAVRFMLIDHIISGTAAHVPIAEIVPRVRSAASVFGAVNLLICVDGAHAPGQIPLSLRGMTDMGVDVYVGNLHKWCFCPKGTAILYASVAAQATIRPLLVSHGYGHGFTAEFDEQGTVDYSNIAAVPAALAFVEHELGGFAALRRYQRELLTAGTALLARALGTPVYHGEAGAMALVLLPDLAALPHLDPAAFASVTRLMALFRCERGITLPFWTHDGRLYFRVSAQAYVDLAAFERLAAVLCELKAGPPLAAAASDR